MIVCSTCSRRARLHEERGRSSLFEAQEGAYALLSQPRQQPQPLHAGVQVTSKLSGSLGLPWCHSQSENEVEHSSAVRTLTHFNWIGSEQR
jgi:hypothetical protein